MSASPWWACLVRILLQLPATWSEAAVTCQTPGRKGFEGTRVPAVRRGALSGNQDMSHTPQHSFLGLRAAQWKQRQREGCVGGAGMTQGWQARLKHALCAAQTCPDPEGFKAALHQYFTEIQQEAAWVEANGAEAMSAVLELVRRHQVPPS